METLYSTSALGIDHKIVIDDLTLVKIAASFLVASVLTAVIVRMLNK